MPAPTPTLEESALAVRQLSRSVKVLGRQPTFEFKELPLSQQNAVSLKAARVASDAKDALEEIENNLVKNGEKLLKKFVAEYQTSNDLADVKSHGKKWGDWKKDWDDNCNTAITNVDKEFKKLIDDKTKNLPDDQKKIETDRLKQQQTKYESELKKFQDAGLKTSIEKLEKSLKNQKQLATFSNHSLIAGKNNRSPANRMWVKKNNALGNGQPLPLVSYAGEQTTLDYPPGDYTSGESKCWIRLDDKGKVTPVLPPESSFRRWVFGGYSKTNLVNAFAAMFDSLIQFKHATTIVFDFKNANSSNLSIVRQVFADAAKRNPPIALVIGPQIKAEIAKNTKLMAEFTALENNSAQRLKDYEDKLAKAHDEAETKNPETAIIRLAKTELENAENLRIKAINEKDNTKKEEARDNGIEHLQKTIDEVIDWVNKNAITATANKQILDVLSQIEVELSELGKIGNVDTAALMKQIKDLRDTKLTSVAPAALNPVVPPSTTTALTKELDDATAKMQKKQTIKEELQETLDLLKKSAKSTDPEVRKSHEAFLNAAIKKCTDLPVSEDTLALQAATDIMKFANEAKIPHQQLEAKASEIALTILKNPDSVTKNMALIEKFMEQVSSLKDKALLQDEIINCMTSIIKTIPEKPKDPIQADPMDAPSALKSNEAIKNCFSLLKLIEGHDKYDTTKATIKEKLEELQGRFNQFKPKNPQDKFEPIESVASLLKEINSLPSSPASRSGRGMTH